MLDGLIIKGIGGFYYVETADGIYECKARGVFRKEKITPLVGDRVKISVNTNAENTIDVIEERKNFLVRPPLANIDRLFIVCSLVSPAINTGVLDRLIAIAEYKEIEPIIVFTKIDLADGYEEYADIYSKAGFKTVVCDNVSGKGSEEIKALLKDKVSAFTGNTGVGKSSLLNNIDSSLSLATGQTSKKLGRGRHTTRACELFKVAGGYVADTPGFSSLDIERCERILKDDLPYCFREFRPYLDECKFAANCSHINDKGCAVKQAVDDGIISKSRHESYVQMYNEVKDIKEWELK
ncbi:MAG: ribosome small subunit-dependent GTPase A [Eubacteriales bacterium]|nr:ribosome small subunit-dependent GTPase A [Eubacteriales bacterium]